MLADLLEAASARVSEQLSSAAHEAAAGRAEAAAARRQLADQAESFRLVLKVCAVKGWPSKFAASWPPAGCSFPRACVAQHQCSSVCGSDAAPCQQLVHPLACPPRASPTAPPPPQEALTRAEEQLRQARRRQAEQLTATHAGAGEGGEGEGQRRAGEGRAAKELLPIIEH